MSINDLYTLFISCNQKITTDTRQIEKGSIFFALKGDNFDANEFAISAIEQGCLYAVVDQPNFANGTSILLVEDVLDTLQNLAKMHRSHLKIPVIGITGSNGKTTNKELIHAVLSKKFNTYATKGNLNNHIGVPLTVLKIHKEHEIAIVEMGANHQGEIAMLSDICDPDFGLITNIGKAHLEGFGGEEGIKIGKSELYKYIEKKNGKIFINGNDPVLIELSRSIDKVYFGENNTFDIYGELANNSEFVELKWNTTGNALDNMPLIRTHLFGHYNFVNVICAICIGNYFGVEKHLINEAISNYLPEMNRSQVKKTSTNTLILDAYNANPSSMMLAIKHFVRQPFPNKFVVLGDMFELGDYSYQEHKLILDELFSHPEVKCLLVGTHFNQFKNDYLGFSFCENINLAQNFIENNKIAEFTILIKGSRGIALEKLVPLL
ncbi:MAG: UDP-N-acetylmuramoyl-tripeptide--D-alanyl-D-alanine ligase [Bacteroidia bacterium]|nr:UDP-N-acetylmuramoyl-tripeptide--D-alanyl-D-alanine ligase [Bacteroidia bacterium]